MYRHYKSDILIKNINFDAILVNLFLKKLKNLYIKQEKSAKYL